MNIISGVKYSRLFLNALSVLTVVTLLLAIFSRLPGYPAKMVMYFCSDTLYLPSVYKDYFIDQNNISGWHFNPAPNFFPDMIFYFLLMYISQNFIVASFIFSFVQCLFLGFILVQLLKIIFPEASSIYTLLIYTLLGVFLLEFFFFSKNFTDVFLLIVNSYHTGGFLMSLICTFFTFKYMLGKNPGWLILLCITGFLCVISDRLFLVLFVIPMSLTCLLMGKKIGWRTSISLIITTVIFAWVGLKVFKSIDTYPYGMLAEAKPAGLSMMMSQAKIYFTQMGNYLLDFGFMALTMHLFIISFFSMIYVFIKSIKNTENKIISFYALFSLVFSVTVILAPIAAGKYEGPDCIRYNVYPFYLGMLNLAVFLMFKRKYTGPVKAWQFALVGLNLLFFVTALTQLRPNGLYDFFNYYPQKARLIDVLSEKENLKQGVANYWDAKEITMFSKRGVKVCAVFDDIGLHQHVSNENWYYDNMFNFVILSKFNDTSSYKSRLTDIQVICNLPKFKVIKTNPFTYLKHVGGAPVNIKIKEK